MEVKVNWRKCKKYSYSDSTGCPLFHTLVEMGVPVAHVGSDSVGLANGAELRIVNHWLSRADLPIGKQIESMDDRRLWGSRSVSWAARRHRSAVADIPGLEDYIGPRATR